ncbi:ficolin-1-like [Rhea pennata]|uniref:ficolin-1-like n=1 Tax=Rhea pennata TaxID=8795 RepID=UPI002E256A78
MRRAVQQILLALFSLTAVVYKKEAIALEVKTMDAEQNKQDSLPEGVTGTLDASDSMRLLQLFSLKGDKTLKSCITVLKLSLLEFTANFNNNYLSSCAGEKNCKELLDKGYRMSGWYTIYLPNCMAINVLCDMHTEGGGWIVFQRRIDGSVDFFRNWEEYKKGFGSQLTDFWLGNEYIHFLTSFGTQELRIDLMDFSYKRTFAKYESFKIFSERDNYKLSLGSFLLGTAGDSLSVHHMMPFSTKDREQDPQSNQCATTYKGAWWFNDCLDSNLNGMYENGEQDTYAGGIIWKADKGYYYSYKQTEMKFRPI